MKDILNPRGRYKYIIDEIIGDIIQGLSTAEISQKYDIPKRTINHWQDKLRKAGINVKKNKLALENHIIHGTTTLYDAEGNVKHQYIKTSLDKQAMLEAMQAAVDAFNAQIEPLSARRIEDEEFYINKRKLDSNLLVTHVLSDYHIGMFSHKEMSGEDWNLEKSKETMRLWIDKACEIAPYTDEGLLIILGDFIHTDNKTGVTPTSGHVLDVSSHYSYIADVAITGIRYMINKMLSKHKKVNVIIASGNHDPVGIIWLNTFMRQFYSNEERVNIIPNTNTYSAFRWGDVSIFAHHGHKRNPNNITETLVAYFREMIGQTKYSYAHIGHFHHRQVKENAVMQIEIHNTLAPRDAYASEGGYNSMRLARSYLYHKKHGEVGVINITPCMLI